MSLIYIIWTVRGRQLIGTQVHAHKAKETESTAK